MARYYMFTQVYFNPIGKALELHFNEWLLEEDRRWPAAQVSLPRERTGRPDRSKRTT